tara:strand:+ start:731 stop:1117 length:387 start_codon:yes stop_codon:yes gene_type:complete
LNFTGKIKNKQIVWNDKPKLVDYISTITENTYVNVEITIKENKRTNKQNKLWWSWMKIISNELGYTKDEIHDILKYKFLLREEIIDGETKQYVKSTSTLTKKEFNELTTKVFYWSNETLGINLPTDDE